MDAIRLKLDEVPQKVVFYFNWKKYTKSSSGRGDEVAVWPVVVGIDDKPIELVTQEKWLPKSTEVTVDW